VPITTDIVTVDQFASSLAILLAFQFWHAIATIAAIVGGRHFALIRVKILATSFTASVVVETIGTDRIAIVHADTISMPFFTIITAGISSAFGTIFAITVSAALDYFLGIVHFPAIAAKRETVTVASFTASVAVRVRKAVFILHSTITVMAGCAHNFIVFNVFGTI
jgi:hypothetical protein